MIEQCLTGAVVIGSGLIGVAASRAVLVGMLHLMTVSAATRQAPAETTSSAKV